MESTLQAGKRMRIEPWLRTMILVELIFPMVLLTFGIYHGLIQELFRAGIIRGDGLIGINYYQGLTAHGVINAIVFTTFFAIAFGHAIFRYVLDRPIHYPSALASMILMILGTLLAAAMIFSGNASVLYTFYPPLKAHPIFYFGLVFLIVGSWIGWWSWFPALNSWKRDNPGKKLPLAVMGMQTTFIIWMIATIPVAIEVIVLLIPWSLGWTKTVNIPLARLLFWFFGHPLVYFWLMPAYAMYYSMLPKLCGGKLFSDFAGRLTFLWFILFSNPVGLHHQFTEPGISTVWKYIHAFFTSLVAIPSLVTAFTLAASMEHGAKARGAKGIFAWWAWLPYFDRERWLFGYFFCGLVIFIFGGITGIVNASYNMNLVVHNTSWLPAHFHQTVAGPVFLAFLGMSLWMVSKLTGKEVRLKGYNVWMPYIWGLGIMIFSLGLFVGGVGGEPRRTNMGLTYTNPTSPLYHVHWAFSKVVGSAGAAIMFTSMVIYFIIFFTTLFGKKTKEIGLEFPLSEPYHDEDVPAVKSFRPWIIAAVLLLCVAYIPPFIEIMQNHFEGAPAYRPDSPLPISEAAK